MAREIEIRSEEVQELLGKPPHWLVRWGMLFALVLLIGTFWLLYALTYPETITTTIQIRRENPGQDLTVLRPSEISEILVASGDSIEEGQTLVVFDNSAEYGDVQTLNGYLTTIARSPGDSLIINYRLPTDLLLGSDRLKDRFDAFIDKQTEVENIITGRGSRLGLKSLQEEIRIQQRIIRAENRNLPLLQGELTLANDNLTYHENLEAGGRGRPTEKRQALADQLRAKRNLEAAKTRIRNSKLKIRQLQEQEEQTTSFSATDKANAISELRNTFTALLSAVDEWEKRNLIISDMAGIVSLDEQKAKVGNRVGIGNNERLGFVLPTDNANLIGFTNLELSKSGQVEPGQKVLVDFPSFPVQQYGVVRGNVSKKSLVPDTENRLRLEVRFPEGLITNKGKALAVGEFVDGTMVIVIEERRLIEWLLDRV